MKDKRETGSQSAPGLKKSILSNWMLFAYTALVGFFLTPFIVRGLGDTMYGIWSLLAAVIAYLGLLDIGVRLAVTRFVASALANGEHKRASRYASTSLELFLAAGTLAILIAIGVAALAPRLFDIPPELITTSRQVLVLGGFTVALTLVAGTFGGIVVARERFDLLNLTELGVQTSRALAVVAILASGGGLLGLAVAHLALAVARLGVTMAVAWRIFPELELRRSLIGNEERVGIVRFGLTFTALSVASALAFSTDSLVIGTFLPVAMITPFAIGASLTQYARSFVSGISYVVTPRSSRLDGVGDTEGIRKMVLASGRGATLILLPITITFMLRGDSFIALWMGPEYAEPSARVLWILSVALSFAAAREVANSSLIGLGKHAGLVPAIVVEGVVNLGLSVLLVRSWSIYGVAWGTTIPNLAVSVAFTPWYLHRTLGIRPADAFVQFWSRPAIAMIAFAVGTYFVELLWPASGLLVFFTQVALTLPLAVAGAWWFAMDPAERSGIAGAVGRLRSRTRPVPVGVDGD